MVSPASCAAGIHRRDIRQRFVCLQVLPGKAWAQRHILGYQHCGAPATITQQGRHFRSTINDEIKSKRKAPARITVLVHWQVVNNVPASFQVSGWQLAIRLCLWVGQQQILISSIRVCDLISEHAQPIAIGVRIPPTIILHVAQAC